MGRLCVPQAHIDLGVGGWGRLRGSEAEAPLSPGEGEDGCGRRGGKGICLDAFGIFYGETDDGSKLVRSSGSMGVAQGSACPGGIPQDWGYEQAAAPPGV